MTAKQIIESIHLARQQGVEVAIEMPREGFWVDPADKLSVRDGDLYWEHVNGRTYIVPAHLIWLQFMPKVAV